MIEEVFPARVNNIQHVAPPSAPFTMSGGFGHILQSSREQRNQQACGGGAARRKVGVVITIWDSNDHESDEFT